MRAGKIDPARGHSPTRFGREMLKKEEAELYEEPKDAADEGEYDYEGDMAKSQLRSIIYNAQKMHDMLEDNTNLPEWVQSKITLAEDYISTAANYMQGEMNEQAAAVVKGVFRGRRRISSAADEIALKQHARNMSAEDLAELNAIRKARGEPPIVVPAGSAVPKPKETPLENQPPPGTAPKPATKPAPETAPKVPDNKPPANDPDVDPNKVVPFKKPAPETAPATKPDVVPVTVPVTAPKPATKPAVVPVTVPVTAPKPATKPAVVPVTVPVTAPATKPAPKPAAVPVTAPATKPAPKPAAVPVTAPATSPRAKPAAVPVTVPVTAPATKPAPKPATKPAPKPATKPAPKPAAVPVTVPVTAPKSPTKPSKPSGFPLMFPPGPKFSRPGGLKFHRGGDVDYFARSFEYGEIPKGYEFNSYDPTIDSSGETISEGKAMPGLSNLVSVRKNKLAKLKASKASPVKEALDAVGKEDTDVNNDGMHNTTTDKYLTKKREAIRKAIMSKTINKNGK
jgi:hypothetical protein